VRSNAAREKFWVEKSAELQGFVDRQEYGSFMTAVHKSGRDKGKYSVSGTVKLVTIDVDEAAEQSKSVLAHVGKPIMDEARKHLPNKRAAEYRLQDKWVIHDIQVALGKMKLDKATGPDEIPVEFYIEGGEKIQKVLLDLCNLALDIGYVPNDWKDNHIQLLLKKGDPRLLDNYRPIALLSHAGKVLERLLQERFLAYITTVEDCIPDTQFGFLKS
jgi:hypothetical protein